MTPAAAPPPRLQRAAAYTGRLWVLAAACVPLSTLAYAVAAYSPVQLHDQWEEVLWLQRYAAGGARFSDLWRLHNEHSILFPRFFILADLFLFRGTNALLTPVNLALQAVTCALYARFAWRTVNLSRPLVYFLVGVYLVVLPSAVQMENFIWGFQVTFLLVFCAAVGSIVCISRYGTSLATGVAAPRWLALGCGAAIVATFSMVNGILIWPVLVLLAFASRLRGRDMALLVCVATAVIGVRLAIGIPGADLTVVLTQPRRVLTFFCWYLGTPFRHVSVFAVQRLGIAGGMFTVLIPVYFAGRRRRLEAFQATHLAVIAFVAGSGLATSIGRQHWPLDILLNTRYATPALLFWASAVSLVVYETRAAARGARMVRACVVAVVVLVLATCAVPAHMVAGPAQRGYSRSAEYATLALVVGVEDETSLTNLHTHAEVLLPLVPFLRDRRLGLFSEEWTAHLNRPLADVYAIDVASDAARPAERGVVGKLESAGPLPTPEGRPAPPEGAIVEGWAWDVQGRRPVALVLLVNPAGVIRGFALPHVPRPDITTRYGPELPGSLENAGWFGFVASRGDFPVRAYGVRKGTTIAYPLSAGPDAPAQR